MNEKVAFFDFCETLTDFQTADAYVDFVRDATGRKRMRFLNALQLLMIKLRVIRVLTAMFPRKSINKRLKLFQLKGIPVSELDDLARRYYLERIRPHFIKRMIEELQELKANGYDVGLVSGGYGIYLKYFVDEFALDFCISSNLEIKDGVCTGRMDGIDCLNDNKIIFLDKRFDHSPRQSVAYSDSRSDKPLLDYTSEGVVVSHGNHQEWSTECCYREIVWHE